MNAEKQASKAENEMQNLFRENEIEKMENQRPLHMVS